LGVSRQGEFKNTIKMFLQKVGKKIKYFDKNFDVSFSSAFFVLSRFRVFSAMGVQKHYKKRCTKRSCRKVFTKKSTKNPKPSPFLEFSFITFLGFGRFSMRGVQKHDKKISKK
jgi:hypothetical protein